MTSVKQTQALQTKSNKKNGHRPEPVVLSPHPQVSSSTSTADLFNASPAADEHGNITSQAAQLYNSSIQTIQRQTIAKQIGQIRGNSYLQRVVETIGVANPAARRIQRDTAPIQTQPAPQIGWKGAPTASPNVGETTSKSGGTLRIPLSGLEVGVKSKVKTDMAYENANNEAIALVPAALAGAKEAKRSVEVLLHLHGYGIGYRTRKTQLTTTPNSTSGLAVPDGEVGTVRDVALDHMADQIEASGREVIGVLPQGNLKSRFGDDFNSDVYIQAVFKALKTVGKLGEGIQPGGVILTGHSGGGDRIYSMIADKKQPKNLREVVLFDGIHNSTEVNGFLGWLESQIKKDLNNMQSATSTIQDQATLEKAQAAWLRNNGFRFRAYHSKGPDSGYGKRYEALRVKLEAVFQSNREINALGPETLQALRDNYHLHENKKGAWSTGVNFHERVVGTSGGIEKALKALPGGASTTKAPVPAGTQPPVQTPAVPGTAPLVPVSNSKVKPSPSKSKDTKKKQKAAGTALTQATLTQDERTRLAELRDVQKRWIELHTPKGKKLSEEEKVEKKELLKKLSEGNKIIAKGDMENDLKKVHKTSEEWFAGIRPGAKFMDVPIRASGGAVGGVHQELLTRLEMAETNLINLMNEADEQTKTYTSKAQYAQKIGLYSLNGLRPPKPATGGSRPSMHCYGLAIDVNYKGNPFVGNAKKVAKTAPKVIENATLLVTGEKMKVTENPGKKDAMEMWDRLHKESEALKTYLSLRKDDNKDKLAQYVTKAQQAGDKRSVEDWKKLIEQDYAAVHNKGDFANHSDPAESGFMDLDRILVEALTQAGLLWGGQYRGAKDIMHFDWREGTIKR